LPCEVVVRSCVTKLFLVVKLDTFTSYWRRLSSALSCAVYIRFEINILDRPHALVIASIIYAAIQKLVLCVLLYSSGLWELHKANNVTSWVV